MEKLCRAWTLVIRGCPSGQSSPSSLLCLVWQDSFMGSCCCSVAQSCPTLCDPVDCSTSGLPVLHRLLEFAQVHVHCIADAVQPSHPLMPSSPSARNLSQHQGLFEWVGSSHQVTKILELQSFQWLFRVDLPSDWFVWSSCCHRKLYKYNSPEILR